MKKVWLACIVITSTALFSCAEVDLFGLDPDNFTQGGSSGGENFLCNDVDSDFSTDVLPMLQQTCGTSSGCHVAGASIAGMNLFTDDDFGPTTPSAIIGSLKNLNDNSGMINTGTPAASTILRAPLAQSADGISHGGGDVFGSTSDPDYLTLRCWIESGAKNDLTSSSCNFGEHVFPILQNRTCANSCHAGTGVDSAGDLSLGVGTGDLANTSELFAELQEESINQRIDTAEPETSALLTKPLGMSHGGGQIFANTSENDYQKILCWIEEGAQNN